MKLRIIYFSNLIILILFLSFVQTSNNKNTPIPITPWSKTDLKLLDPIDSTTGNSCDILAIYLRKLPNNIEIRVDFLYDDDVKNCILRINFRKPGQENFHFTINENDSDRSNLTVIFNENQKYILIRLSGNYSRYELNFELRDKNYDYFCDSTDYTNLYAQSPSPILINLYAYDAHPGYLPSQIMRNWDGAHTGPNGQRHGLKYFLEAVKFTNIPVTLLDINSPSALTALEFLDVSNQLRELQESSILFLPININLSGKIVTRAQEISSQFELTHNYLNQNMVYYKANQEILLNNYAYAKFYNKFFPKKTINLPQEKVNTDPFSKEGLSVDTIKKLMQLNDSGISPSPITFSLKNSNIADQAFANIIFSFIKNHPWLEVVSPRQNNYHSKQSNLNTKNILEMEPIFSEDFENSILQSSGPFNSTMVNYMNDVAGRIQIPEFEALSKNYLTNIHYYIKANIWAEKPIEETRCDSDIDFDGSPECIISNQQYFAIIELDGGRLAFLATRTTNAVYQIIAPSSTIMFGLGVSNEGNTVPPALSDSDEIPGAFFDNKKEWDLYEPVDLSNNGLIIHGTNNNKKKYFSLESDGLHFSQSGITNSQLLIPIILLPDCTDQIKWQNQYKISSNSDESMMKLQCSTETVTINSYNSTRINYSTFLESVSVMNIPENPDYSYTNGHYQKLGLTLIEFNQDSNNLFSFRISK